MRDNERYEQAKRKAFQRAKSLSSEKFWAWMNDLHSQAYYKAVQHYREAAEIVLPPRYQKQLHDKADEIREKWDGMYEIGIDFSAWALEDILREVQKEMKRASDIHGETYTDLHQAREAIDEEWAEVLEAIEKGDREHAAVEIIQLIGVVVKLLRGLDELMSEQSAARVVGG